MAVENLARALDQDIRDDEEIIITGEHECTSNGFHATLLADMNTTA